MSVEPASESRRKMHTDELDIDIDLVRRLLARQFPHWAELGIEPVASAGTDNALYRLGSDLVVRLPRVQWSVEDVAKEHRWLPRVAPWLPVRIPQPLVMGRPTDDYPSHWSVYGWLDGDNPVVGQVADPGSLAHDIARFVVALHAIDPTGGPPASRGVPLQERDGPTREAIKALEERIDRSAVTDMWDAAVGVPAWRGSPVWIHGDLSPGNLLIIEGRLSAVIDFGGLGIGDPASDLIVAWNLLPVEARMAYRTATGVDDATWSRGRGWALSVALIQLPYYWDTNPALAANARHVIAEVLADGDVQSSD